MALLSTEAPWVLAARPATLWAGVAPVLVGSGLAAGDDEFRWSVFLVTIFAAVWLQIGVNFANDVADAARGADTADRIGPARAVASGLISPQQMRIGVATAFGLAAVAGIVLTSLSGWQVLAIGLASIIAALGYTAGPFPYGYHGLGEAFVFVFFGLVATAGTYWVHGGSLTGAAWILGAAMGLLAAAILVVNNIRDMETDAAAGKRTLAVMMGRSRAQALYAGTVIAAFAIVAAAAVTGVTPGWTWLGLLAAPLAIPLVRSVATEREGPQLIAALKGTARLQLVTSLLVGAGAAL